MSEEDVKEQSKFSMVSLEDSWMLQVKEFDQKMKSQGYVKVITDTGGFQWIKKD